MGVEESGLSSEEVDCLQEELERAAENGDQAGVAAAIARGADPERPGPWRETPLMRAIQKRKPVAALALLPFANPIARSLKDWSAIMVAARMDMVEVVAALLADVRALSDQEGLDEALRVAAGAGATASVRMLLPLANPLAESGESCWQDDSKGWTAMMAAARGGSKECCELLAGRSDLGKISPEGRSCWDEAREQGHVELAVWLQACALARRESEALGVAVGSSDGEGAKPRGGRM